MNPNETMTLYGYRLSKEFPDKGYSLLRNFDLAKKGSVLYHLIGELVRNLEMDGREWSVAQILCNESQVSTSPNMARRYIALENLISEEGFMPARTAFRQYGEN
jgi:hypothetical protein